MLAWVGLGYLAIGATATAIAAVVRRPALADLVMLACMWPIAAPMLFVRERSEPTSLTSTLAQAISDPETARVVSQRVRAAERRHDELRAVLGKPELAPDRHREHPVILASLRQLGTLRERYAEELTAIRALIAQLATHGELVRIQPAAAGASEELLAELVARLDELAELEIDAAKYSDLAGRSD